MMHIGSWSVSCHNVQWLLVSDNMWQIDMYTRVKRERRHVKRDMYGIAINDDSKDKTASSGNSETESKLLV